MSVCADKFTRINGKIKLSICLQHETSLIFLSLRCCYYCVLLHDALANDGTENVGYVYTYRALGLLVCFLEIV